jgi:energy-coupling factor transporter ATP-binding protein EcfA2
VHSILRDVATSKLASDLSSGSKKPEPDNSVPTSEIYSWASRLACESRGPNWIDRWYVPPKGVIDAARKLETMDGGIVALIGQQGVGKSSALLALSGRGTAWPDADKILFKWKREPNLYASLLRRTHPLSTLFYVHYGNLLSRIVEARSLAVKGRSEREEREELCSLLEQPVNAETMCRARDAWHEMFLAMRTIFIDTQDYSKTDRRMMARDLGEIYWLWDSICHRRAFDSRRMPNFVVAVQKEMFRDHFFFDKMEKVELEPLKPEQMVEAYRKRFKTIKPFTEDALLALGRMSRGIFRRFLRYITLTLQYSESHGKKIINTETVKEAVTVERLAEDMELELVELFPKQSDLRLQAVRLLIHLEESGPNKQTELAEELGLEGYAMSRLLAKLELHRYIARRREGTDKFVSLLNTSA